MNDELDAAEKKLRGAFEKVFARLPLIPADIIQSVHSYGIAEDGKTLIVMLDTVNGATLMIQAMPRRPISVGMV